MLEQIPKAGSLLPASRNIRHLLHTIHITPTGKLRNYLRGKCGKTRRLAQIEANGCCEIHMRAAEARRNRRERRGAAYHGDRRLIEYGSAASAAERSGNYAAARREREPHCRRAANAGVSCFRRIDAKALQMGEHLRLIRGSIGCSAELGMASRTRASFGTGSR